jgi:nucleotide-binding universal stress UspA family protein
MYKRILGPLDGSKLSECSLDHIKAIATGCQVPEVVLLAVLEVVPLPVSWVESEEQAERVAKERQQLEKTPQKAQAYLARAADSLKKVGIPVQTVVIPAKTGVGAAEGILDYAENNEVDLIIMSTHGRSGVSRWAMGSVADKVVRHAKVPVMTVVSAGCRL